MFSKVILALTIFTSLAFSQQSGGSVGTPIMPLNPYPLPCYPPTPTCPSGWNIDGQCLRKAMQNFHRVTDQINNEAKERFNVITLTFQATMTGAQTNLSSCLAATSPGDSQARQACRSTFNAIRDQASNDYWNNTRTLMESTRNKLEQAKKNCEAALRQCCRVD